jgi:hypothetical protein
MLVYLNHISAQTELHSRYWSFDVLIMDEGQDLLNMADLNKLDGVLKGGFVNGQWYFFHDANNQSNLLAAVEPDALDWLKSKNNPAVLKLRVNCRNTTNILNAIQSELKCDLGKPTLVDGPEVIEYSRSWPSSIIRTSKQSNPDRLITEVTEDVVATARRSLGILAVK